MTMQDDTFIVWTLDDIDSTFYDSEEDPRPLYVCYLCLDCDYDEADLVRGYSPRDGMFERPGRIVECLGGIDDYSDPYAGEIKASLVAEFEARREANVMRGDN